MEFVGEFKGLTEDWETGKRNIIFQINSPFVPASVEGIRNCNLNITAKKYRQKRSLDANGLLWLCLGRIAEALHADKWDIYLQMLKRYGKYTYICVKQNVVDAVKQQWRECEVIGEVNINGQTAIQLLCYFGSSTYDTKEFSTLLDGVISEMKEMGIEAPASKEMERALELWEKQSRC